ncbi:MAG TPA: DUF3048 domain-containing protein [Candidatus Saccharimonadales bacterium]
MDGPTQTHANTHHRLSHWVHAHKTATAVITTVALLIATAICVWALFYQPPVAQTPHNNLQGISRQAKPKYYSPLTGIEVADDATTKRQVTAIMIENSPDARPQSGLKTAGIVYEAIAEGGITRFQCLYQEARPGLIGPVRSLRPYYLEWAAPYDASFAHIGGSKRALDTVRNGQYKDIDQFFNAGAYYRSTDRYAPHNVYTTFDRLDELNVKKGFTSSTFQGFSRNKKEAPLPAPNAGNITIAISGALFNSSYTYDKASNSYLRFQAGQPHLDREAGHINPKVVIVMKVHMYRGFEDGYREQIDTNGAGQVFVFQNGTVIEGQWRKNGAKSPLNIVDATGQPIALNAGQTWVTTLPQDRNVSWQ